MKIQIGCDAGTYWWRTIDDRPGWRNVATIPIWRYWWLCFMSRLSRRVDRYLRRLGNEIHEREECR